MNALFIYSWQCWELKAERCVRWARTRPLCKHSTAELPRQLKQDFVFVFLGLWVDDWQGQRQKGWRPNVAGEGSRRSSIGARLHWHPVATSGFAGATAELARFAGPAAELVTPCVTYYQSHISVSPYA